MSLRPSFFYDLLRDDIARHEERSRNSTSPSYWMPCHPRASLTLVSARRATGYGVQAYLYVLSKTDMVWVFEIEIYVGKCEYR